MCLFDSQVLGSMAGLEFPLGIESLFLVAQGLEAWCRDPCWFLTPFDTLNQLFPTARSDAWFGCPGCSTLDVFFGCWKHIMIEFPSVFW